MSKNLDCRTKISSGSEANSASSPVVYQEGTNAPDVHVVLYDGSAAHGKHPRSN